MEPKPNHAPLVAIVGPTASGKSEMAIRLAQKFNGEIIAADSRTIYKGMDIGTAKPTKAEQRLVRHHLIDVVSPDQHFTVADFKALANEAILDIRSRGKLPILAGGTGLYVDAVLYNFSFRKNVFNSNRAFLESLSVGELQKALAEGGIALPRNAGNPRHLIRQIETGGQAPTRSGLMPNALVLGLNIDTATLKHRIADRVDNMVSNGLIEEVASLSQTCGWQAPAMQTPAYKAFRQYIEGSASLDEAELMFGRSDYQYSRRQRTWFKRNQDMHWISKIDEAVALITTLLNNKSTGD